jgi:hypothetical protein
MPTLILWCLLLILPLQAIGLVIVDARGPAHTHRSAHAPKNEARAAEARDVDTQDLSPPTRHEAAHHHEGVSHHHHAERSNVVAVPEADLHYDALALEEGSGANSVGANAPPSSSSQYCLLRGSLPQPDALAVRFTSTHPIPLDRPPTA